MNTVKNTKEIAEEIMSYGCNNEGTVHALGTPQSGFCSDDDSARFMLWQHQNTVKDG